METNRMKILKQIHHILCILAMAALAACSTAADGDSDGNGELTIRFTATPPTRTTLTNSDPAQHVTYVQVYVFDGTSADARCIASENVGWEQLTGTSASQYYTLKTRLALGMEYTIVAVGLDCSKTADGTVDTSGNAYGLPDAIKIGTTLGNTVATLAEGKKQGDIATTELFAGSATTVVSTAGNVVDLTLSRCVAGVLAYFTNIPKDVTRIDLVLYANQRKNVPLTSIAASEYQPEEIDGSQVLLSIPVTNDILKGETVTDKDGNTIDSKLPGTVLQGAYLLPLPAPSAAATGTMMLKLYNGDSELKSYPVAQKESKEQNFAIEANVIYTIGDKTATTDEPYDLGGDEGLGDDIIYVDGNWQVDVDIDI